MCPNKYDFSAEANETNKELESCINKLRPFNNDELSEMLPNQSDQAQFNALIEAVNQQTTANGKKKILIDRLGTASAIVKDCVIKIIGYEL